jgi:tRNA G18 (ribose-2'-O)-methylase SpoU
VSLDPDDPRFDGFRRLNEPRFRRDYEVDRGVFVAEGPTVVAHVISHAGALVEALMVDARMRDRIPVGLDAPVHVVTQDFVSQVVGFDFHRGMLAVCRRPTPSTVSHLASLSSLVAIEGVSDHENLGAIFRAAAALGVEGVLLDPTTADPWYRRSVRVSMGTVVDVPVARSRDWPGDLGVLSAAGMTLVAATPAADAMDVRTVEAINRPVVMLGAEGPGLTGAALSRASVRVRIPMHRGVDSLNVGQAAAVLFDRILRPDAGR